MCVRHIMRWRPALPACPAGPPVFMAIYTINARLLLSWNVWALPALALIPLSMGHRLCGRLLQSPGVEVPLAGLFSLVDTAQ